MKRSIFLILTISVLLLISNFTQARNVSMELRLLKPNVNVGDEFAVELNLESVSDLKGINILISYDNLKLEYKSLSKGILINNFVEDISTEPKKANETGKIEYLAVLEAPGPGIDSARENLLTINFVAKSPGDAWIKLSPNEFALGDSTAKAIPYNIDTDSVTVKIGQIFALKRIFNYPNPAPDATGKTIIRCESLAILDDLEARIYDISGELVKKISYQEFNTLKAPTYEYEWNCKNEKDIDVANGVYILWIKAKMGSDEKNETWKIAILR